MTKPQDETGEHMLTPGSRVAQYEIISLLGEGGVGEVYLARHLAQSERVAVKVIRNSAQAGFKAISRFRREARAASRIRHHNVTKILEFGTVEETPFLVMEYVDGPTLEQYIEEHSPLSIGESVSILIQVAEALEAAHACRVIHRDLKPRNVLLADDRGQRQVKVLDFGLAKILDPGETTGLTSAGTIVGTPLYMSPEQVTGSKVNLLTDIYSFGALAYELITGAPPFTGSLPEVLRAHVLLPVVPPSDVAAGRVSSELDRLVLHCLAKEPQDRIPGASALLEQLRGLG